MGIYLNDGDSKKELRKLKRTEIVEDINNKFCEWYDDLEQPRRDTVALLKELFPDYNRNKKDVKKIPSLYEQYKTYTSAISKATYGSYEGMFDVEGQDLRSNNLSATYKASLIYDYNKMHLKNSLDAVLDDWTIKGEGALFVHWDEDITKKPTIVIDEFTGEPTKSFSYESEDAHVHIRRIDPHNLYFDKSQRYNWCMCGKIIREFVPIQYVLTNQLFKFTKEERVELESLISNTPKTIDLHEEKKSKDRKILGKTVEVLEYRGDYIHPVTGKVIKDVVIVVVAGKYLARLEESEYIKCPIVYGSYLDRPDTGRGQSPLKPVYIINEVENMCMDLSLKAWELNTNPVFIAPKGAFQSYTRLEAGKPLEYDPATLGGQPPQKVDFSSGMSNFEFQKFFRDSMEGSTGISQYLQGSTEGTVRTASESSYIQQGATMRINREANLFINRIIIPMVETHSLFKRVMETEDKEIKITNNDGSTAFAKIDDEIRNGRYTFIIGGSQSQVEREADIQKLFSLLGTPAFQSLAQLMDIQTASELLKWILNRANFKGTDQVFELMNLNSKILQQAKQMGVQPQNQNGFVGDMQSMIEKSIPDMAQELQAQPEQLPQ